jgi:hypothetical protein
VPALVRYIPYKTSTRRHHGHTDTAYYPACEYQGGLPEEPDSVTTKAISGASTTPPLAFAIHTSAMPKGSVVYIETGFAWTATLLTSSRLPRCVPACPPDRHLAGNSGEQVRPYPPRRGGTCLGWRSLHRIADELVSLNELARLVEGSPNGGPALSSTRRTRPTVDPWYRRGPGDGRLMPRGISVG